MTHIPKPLDALPLTSLVALTQTAVGCGVGLLIAGRMRESVQKNTAIAMLSVGLLSTMSLGLGFAARAWNGPSSARAARRRLRSIREDSGFRDDVEIV